MCVMHQYTSIFDDWRSCNVAWCSTTGSSDSALLSFSHENILRCKLLETRVRAESPVKVYKLLRVREFILEFCFDDA